MDELMRAVEQLERAARLSPSRGQLYGIIGRMARSSEAVDHLKATLDEIEEAGRDHPGSP